MLKDIIKQPNFPNTPLGRRSRFWFYRLFEKVACLRQYENLPESINRDYLETVLLCEGSIIWCKDNEGLLRCLRGAHYGFDCYMYPTTFNIANPVLGNIKGTFGVNGVWMRNNKYATNVVDIIYEYAIQLAQLDINLSTNLDNLKVTKVFTVNNDAEARQVKELYNKIITGEPAVITKRGNEWLSDENVNIFSSDIQYYGTQLLNDRRTIINDFLTQFGINNVSVEKRERLITDEVNANNQELDLNKAYWLEPVKEALEKINSLFGTNINVYIKGPDVDEIVKEEVDVDVV